jgi:hypothetical protein
MTASIPIHHLRASVHNLANGQRPMANETIQIPEDQKSGNTLILRKSNNFRPWPEVKYGGMGVLGNCLLLTTANRQLLTANDVYQSISVINNPGGK